MSTGGSEIFLTTSEAARLLKISAKLLRRLVRLGQVPVRRFGSKGRLWRFLKADLLAPVPTAPSVTINYVPPVGVVPRPSASGRTLTRVKGGGFRYR